MVTYGTANGAGSSTALTIQKNGTGSLIGGQVPTPVASSNWATLLSCVVSCNGTTDYINLYRPIAWSSSYWLATQATNVAVMLLT
jgi:hypothetical protein